MGEQDNLDLRSLTDEERTVLQAIAVKGPLGLYAIHQFTGMFDADILPALRRLGKRDLIGQTSVPHYTTTWVANELCWCITPRGKQVIEAANAADR